MHRAALRRCQRQHCHERSGFDLGRMRARNRLGVSPAIQRGGKLGIIGVDAHGAAGCGNGAKQRILHCALARDQRRRPAAEKQLEGNRPALGQRADILQARRMGERLDGEINDALLPASAAASKPLTLSIRGAVFGIAMMVVTPPRAAAHEAERKSSL